ncbi:MAG TPA: Lrp/AsnC family transcriptional regulator [Allosphingosinicella sp.]|nr:Lrp/AsnC family transcriptional regulator [Allosphingosinicella sp.]
MRARLDRLDLKLLACLQEDNLQTADALAEKVGRSPSAVARRVRRLRATGAIAADVALLSEEAAGFPLSAVVQIQLERHAPQAEAGLRRALVASSNVQLCLDISGAFDILLLVVATDMDDYNRVAAAHLEGHAAVRRFETSFVKRRVKSTLALPLDALARAERAG